MSDFKQSIEAFAQQFMSDMSKERAERQIEPTTSKHTVTERSFIQDAGFKGGGGSDLGQDTGPGAGTGDGTGYGGGSSTVFTLQ